MQRLHILIKGLVQGVGFRPFIFGLAARYKLAGWVRNNPAGVEIEAEGSPDCTAAFVRAIHAEAPPLAAIATVLTTPLPPQGTAEFTILPSAATGSQAVLPAPDIAICRDCRAEIADKQNRRYQHAFANCTNCGPRYSIIKALPYDRISTTMAGFGLCHDCRTEYGSPLNRRFHAQPTACPACGPQYRLLDADGKEYPLATAASIWTEARRLVLAGKIVAIKGIGGFHLACDAYHNAAVELLRRKKKRETKPLAVMAGSRAAIAGICTLSPVEYQLLSGPAAPIVLLDKSPTYDLAPAVAPDTLRLGVMLPYTPAHCLLLQTQDIWVMTSGNHSDEPIIYQDDDALEQMSGIADYFLIHNRPIHRRVDDSIVRLSAGTPAVLRRSRGFIPLPLDLPWTLPPVLACGGQLKSTFCLSSGRQAYLSSHIGDLTNPAAYDYYEESVEQYRQLLKIQPQTVAHDLHPGYLSTQYARSLSLPAVAVQHHHAHIAAVMGEYGLHQPVIGIAFDGTGLGTDGTLWGGEFLVAGYQDCTRLAHLAYLPLPGGEKAIREPWRMALAVLLRLYGENFTALNLPLIKALPPEWPLVARQLDQSINSPQASSAGRLFDIAAALCNLCLFNRYEGQAAALLEYAAGKTAGTVLPYEINPLPVKVLNLLPAYQEMIRLMGTGESVPFLAASFHNTLAAAACRLTRDISTATGITAVVLSGGVFQNFRLLESLTQLLQDCGLTVYKPSLVPPNDAGVSFGQLLIAAAKHCDFRQP